MDFGEGPQTRSAALAPKPNLSGGSLAGAAPRVVHRMVAQHVSASLHQVSQHIAAGALREIVGNRPIGDIMRRLRLGIRREWRGAGAAVGQDVSIADSRVELE